MTTLYSFDEQGTKRIVKTVRWAESQQLDQTPLRSRFVTSYDKTPAIDLIVSASVEVEPNIYRYSALVAERPDGGYKWQPSQNPAQFDNIYNESENGNTATLIQGVQVVGGTSNVTMMPIANGQKIRAWPAGTDGAGLPIYYFDRANLFNCG